MKSVNLASKVPAGTPGTFAMTALMYAAPLVGLPPWTYSRPSATSSPWGSPHTW